ncbi:MAG TPA: glycosyltransferase family 2 protein [Patescibacteria group bacterium]|nr:glycosyltransferase family 2 protein [Patescibacteria group bacterium]
MKIIIILPTYNEKTNIEKMIPLLEREVFSTIKGHDLHILVVDDKSPDGTADVVKKYREKWKNVHLLSGDKQGLGRAYVRGMKYAMEEMHADAVMEFDADFQHDPHDIPRLISAMDEGADYVIGSRYIKGGAIPKEWAFDRKVKSKLGGLIARYAFFMFRLHDVTSGFKLTKTSFLKRVQLDRLYSYNYAYKLHILHDVVHLGAKVKEVPIVFYERTKGKSKMDTNDMTESLYVVLKLAIYDHKRFVKFLFVGGTGFIVQYSITYLCILLGFAQHFATMIAAETAILSNFTLNNLWTFGDTKHVKEQGGFLRRLIKFNTASLASIGIQGFSTYLAVKFFGEVITIYGYSIHTALAILFPTIIFIVLPLNYFVYNKIIWKTHHLKKYKQQVISE